MAIADQVEGAVIIPEPVRIYFSLFGLFRFQRGVFHFEGLSMLDRLFNLLDEGTVRLVDLVRGDADLDGLPQKSEILPVLGGEVRVYFLIEILRSEEHTSEL